MGATVWFKHFNRSYIMIQRILAAWMLIGMLAAATGCNTIEGAGKDIERAGEATQDTARDVKRKM
jgi:entericidin B